ncbi:glycosyltransferase family 4 protein [Devosia honganensis]|uniref:Glycosyltransferase family 4 protein n=1 Tax=Devosia honganensis TaxID=1610527 RepID=A0ABV7X185_9HYPH
MPTNSQWKDGYVLSGSLGDRLISKRVAIIGNQGFSLLNFRGPLIEAIVSRGHEVYALAPQLDRASMEALQALGANPVEITLSRTGLNPFRDTADTLKLRRLLAELSLDAVLAFAIKPVIYGTIAAALARVPARFALIAGLGYAFSENATDTPKGMLIHHAAKTLYRFALSQTKGVFMQNPDDADDFVRLDIVTRDKIVRVNGTGVDLAAWTPAPAVLSPVTFTFVGRLLRDKGVMDFIAAARMVKAACPQARFLLVGGQDDNPGSIAASEVRQWVAEGLVEWPGHVPVRPWLEQTSVFVLPSYYREGIPRSTQEAMAMARAIVTTDSVGCRETVVEGRNGYLVPPRDPEALAAAMRRFIDDPQKIAAMGQQSRHLAEARFDVRQVNAKIIEAMGL